MKQLTILSTLFAFALVSFGQNFCPAGGRANGFVEWTKLAPPPAGGGAFSQTIPVSGISGLNVTISAPASPTSTDPSYRVLDGTRLLVSGGQRDVTFTFNRYIRGLRMVAEMTAFGGFEESLSLKGIGGVGTVAHPSFSVSTSQHNDSPNHVTLTPLQITADTADGIDGAVLSFAGDEDYNGFIIGNMRIETGSEDSDPAAIVPVQGLRQWFRADKGLVRGNHANDSVSAWQDQSPSRADAIQDDVAKYPFAVQQNGEYCRPSVRFGSGSFLKASLPIGGWNQMTIFLMARSYSDPSDGSYHSFHPAISWRENGSWGMTYLSPFQTHLAFRFGTGQPFNYPEVQRDSNVGGDLTLTTAVHDESVDSLYVNGQRVADVTGRLSSLSNVSSDEFIGLGSQGTWFTGDISEILIYDRVLTEVERKTIESYLARKYGAF